MTTVQHDTKAFIDGERVIFGTTRAFHQKLIDEDNQRVLRGGPSYHNLPVAEYVAQSRARGHELFWVILECGVITSSRAFYDERDRQDTERAKLASGDLVELEKRVFRIERTHNSNFKLVDLTLGYSIGNSSTTYSTYEEAVGLVPSGEILWRHINIDGGSAQVV